METIATALPTKGSAVREVWASPLYRGATMAMFLSGLGTSAAAPQIVLYLVKELGASLPVAGLYYLTSLVGPLAGYVVGSYSDRTGIRLNLFRLCAVAGDMDAVCHQRDSSRLLWRRRIANICRRARRAGRQPEPIQ